MINDVINSPDISSYLNLDNRLSKKFNLDATFRDIEEFVLCGIGNHKDFQFWNLYRNSNLYRI